MLILILLLLISGCAAINEPISNINVEVNRYPYVSDERQYGLSEFRQRIGITGKGDCEDFALEKIYRLKQIGVKSKLGVVGMFGGYHAVVVVEGRILDNNTDNIYTVEDFCASSHYKCYF